MPMSRKVTFGVNARQKMTKALNMYEAAVVSTLGPYGSRVVLNKGELYPVVTKDGATVSDDIWVKDPVENSAISIAKEAAARTNKLAGDGTTSTTLLSVELAKAGFELVNRGYNANILKKGMLVAQKKLLEELKKVKRNISNETEIKKVALVSCNGDEEIADIVTEAFCGIGEYGVVTTTDSFNEKTFVNFSAGLEIPKGTGSAVYFNEEKERCFEADNPFFYLSYQRIDDWEHIRPLIDWADNYKKTLICIAPKFSEKVEQWAMDRASRGIFSFLPIQTPGFNQDLWKANIEDLGVALNTPVANKTEVSFPDETLFPAKLGTCKKIKAYMGKTVFIGIDEEREEFKTLVQNLNTELKKMEESSEQGFTEYQKDKIKERLARLSGGVATIYVGDITPTALLEKKHRFEDATSAVRVALQEGVLPGAGIALLKISKKLKQKANAIQKEENLNKEALEGFKLVLEQCPKVFKVLVKQAGYDYETLSQKINLEWKTSEEFFKGPKLSGSGTRSCDFYEEGILDPYKVIEQEIVNSVSVGITLTSVNCIITDDSTNLSLEANDPEAVDFERIMGGL